MSTYTPIASQTLGSATASINFSNIPQNYTDLIVVVNAKGSSPQSMRLQFNNDTATNYSATNLYADLFGSPSANSARYTNENDIRVGYVQNGMSTTDFLSCIIQLQNYSNSLTYKTVLSRSTQAVNATVGLWRNTNSVTSMMLFPASGNFTSGSIFNLYGIVTGGGYATGGNTITTDGAYWYHTFTSSGVFTPTKNLTADYLVVAGGGGGGSHDSGESGGGGGAGGLRSTVTATGGGGSLESALSLINETAYTVTVGAGGSGASYTHTPGSNSVFSTITSIGGGGGGEGATGDSAGVTGGSGGGGGGRAAGSTAGSGTANQGYAGEPKSGSIGGGGGGAGEAGGTDGTSYGGDGVAVSISGSSVTYAGGGAGGRSGAQAGTGGGGTTGDPGGNGTANLGGGGGGSNGGGNSKGGNGGSGIVIVRYAV